MASDTTTDVAKIEDVAKATENEAQTEAAPKFQDAAQADDAAKIGSEAAVPEDLTKTHTKPDDAKDNSESGADADSDGVMDRQTALRLVAASRDSGYRANLRETWRQANALDLSIPERVRRRS